MSLRRVRKKVDYAKFCQEEDNSSNNSDGKHILDTLLWLIVLALVSLMIH